jgi:hypothetical protein|nr:hypothetical protein [Yoonia sp.]
MSRLILASVFCAACAAPVLSLFINLPSLTNSPLTPVQENLPSCSAIDAVIEICAVSLDMSGHP